MTLDLLTKIQREGCSILTMVAVVVGVDCGEVSDCGISDDIEFVGGSAQDRKYQSAAARSSHVQGLVY